MEPSVYTPNEIVDVATMRSGNLDAQKYIIDPKLSSAVWAHIFKQARAPGGGKLSRVALGRSSLESGQQMVRGGQPGRMPRHNGSGMSGL
jgi:hypothetical protein